MIPFFALIVSSLLFRLVGFTGLDYYNSWQTSLQAGVAVMLLLAASAHWGAKRADLVKMVPETLPRKEWIVTATGWLEIAGAVGMVVPSTTLAASICLIVLLLAMFPANVRAAREKLTIGGRPVPKLVTRTVLQCIFIGAIVLASPLVPTF